MTSNEEMIKSNLYKNYVHSLADYSRCINVYMRGSFRIKSSNSRQQEDTLLELKNVCNAEYLLLDDARRKLKSTFNLA